MKGANKTISTLHDDIALWPTVLSKTIINFIVTNKQGNFSKIVHKDRYKTNTIAVFYDHFYRIKSNELKEERN